MMIGMKRRTRTFLWKVQCSHLFVRRGVLRIHWVFEWAMQYSRQGSP